MTNLNPLPESCFKTNFNLPPNKSIHTVAASHANAITPAYYWFLVGQINDGVMSKAVCRVENKRFGSVSYHLISI